jgi:hypothetical protein
MITQTTVINTENDAAILPEAHSWQLFERRTSSVAGDLVIEFASDDQIDG